MDLSSVFLIENLSTYNFEDVVFLAADIDAIVNALMQPLVVKDAEKMLFAAYVLKTALDICRSVVFNYTTLEELLKTNWSSGDNYNEKWQFFEEMASKDPVVTVAERMLLSENGERCLGIMQEFFRMYYSKEEFKELLYNVQMSIPRIAARCAYNALKKTINEGSTTSSEGQSEEADVVVMAHYNKSTTFEKHIKEFQIAIGGYDKEQRLKKQMMAIKNLFKEPILMTQYQEALKNEAYYSLNITLLQLYHDNLISKGILYDTNIIMLIFLLQRDGAHDALLSETFLNETRLGGPERLRIVLQELQNFYDTTSL